MHERIDDFDLTKGSIQALHEVRQQMDHDYRTLQFEMIENKELPSYVTKVNEALDKLKNSGQELVNLLTSTGHVFDTMHGKIRDF